MKSDTPPRTDLWLEERHDDVTALRFRVSKVLYSGRSKYQSVEVVETEGLGNMLLNDGLIMVSERDEFIYHDMIAHVPLFVHPNPRQVLVIGGGDGGTAREVLRHPNVERCRMIEIDEMVVRACQEHLPQTASCLDAFDSRLELSFEDGVSFVAETQDRFDVVLVDSTDPIGPAAPLFGAEFYTNVNRVLNHDGIVVSQGESPFYEVQAQRSLLEVLNTQFPRVHIYNFVNLTYPGNYWSFTWASKTLHPLADFDESRVTGSGLEFQYYNPGIHRAAFALPSFMIANLEGLLSPL